MTTRTMPDPCGDPEKGDIRGIAEGVDVALPVLYVKYKLPSWLLDCTSEERPRDPRKQRRG